MSKIDTHAVLLRRFVDDRDYEQTYEIVGYSNGYISDNIKFDEVLKRGGIDISKGDILISVAVENVNPLLFDGSYKFCCIVDAAANGSKIVREMPNFPNLPGSARSSSWINFWDIDYDGLYPPEIILSIASETSCLRSSLAMCDACNSLLPNHELSKYLNAAYSYANSELDENALFDNIDSLESTKDTSHIAKSVKYALASLCQTNDTEANCLLNACMQSMIYHMIEKNDMNFPRANMYVVGFLRKRVPLSLVALKRLKAM